MGSVPYSLRVSREREERDRRGNAAKTSIEIQRVRVVVVGRNEYVADALGRSCRAERRDERATNPLPLHVNPDGKVVDEELRRFGSRHRYGVSRDAAHELVVQERGHRPELRPVQEPFDVAVIERLAWLLEHLGHQREQPARRLGIARRKSLGAQISGRWFAHLAWTSRRAMPRAAHGPPPIVPGRSRS